MNSLHLSKIDLLFPFFLGGALLPVPMAVASFASSLGLRGRHDYKLQMLGSPMKNKGHTHTTMLHVKTQAYQAIQWNIIIASYTVEWQCPTLG